MLRSRVGGEVIEQSANFTPGHRVNEGDLLLRSIPQTIAPHCSNWRRSCNRRWQTWS